MCEKGCHTFFNIGQQLYTRSPRINPTGGDLSSIFLLIGLLLPTGLLARACYRPELSMLDIDNAMSGV